MATAPFVFNIAKGKVNRYADLPLTNDALVLVLLQVTGLQADATLQDYDTLAALIAGGSAECNFTGYARRVLSGVTVTPDDTANTQSADAADPSGWTNTGGANQGVGAAIICYDDDTTTGTDANLIPLVQLMTGTTSADVGVPLNPSFNVAGIFTAS